ncbi:hypothetical protein N7E81_12615 [Reichenbachiella carrageenanivorans]|uniref:Uncharacterized protein n=1 Tax=Reichenbachiella carrageenanivorans TaxID=2979869 RepID=A0ABY6CWA9_9BACT|nr:hypothetical protein [Reichenbachiella carrageenanivorans]UXX78201.1 hypothetical protein N7E81_12615 [Reichenbachiella carrageenanivorans]
MTKIETLQSLYFYRNNLNQKLNEPGWTIWALKGALVTLVWIFVSLFRSDTLDYNTAIKIGFIVYFVYPYIKFVFDNSTENGSKIQETTYFFLKSEITSLRFSFFYELGVFGLLYYSVNYLGYLEGFFKTTFNVLFYIIAFAMIAYVIMAYTPIHLMKKNESKQNKYVKLAGLILKGVPIVILIGLLQSIPAFEYVSLTTLKVGLLFFGIYYIVKILLGLKKNRPIIQAIDDVIEDLTFDKIQPDEANNKLKLIVHGITFRELISPQLMSLLELHRKFDSTCDKINNTLNMVNAKSDDTEESMKLVEALKESVKFNLITLNDLITEISTKTKKIKHKLILFSNDQKYSEDFDIVISQMEEGTLNNSKKLKETTRLISIDDNETVDAVVVDEKRA